MVIYRKSVSLSRNLSIIALFVGILGLVFCWWTPFGMVLALAGFVLGLASWILSPHRPAPISLAIISVVVSAFAVAVNLFIALGGYETMQFTALR